MKLLQKRKFLFSGCFFLFSAVSIDLGYSIPESWAKESSAIPAADETQSRKDQPLQLEELTITAEKRAQNIQDTPVSITALDAGIIEDARIGDMDDIAGFTPGLEFRNAGSRRHSLTFMRGIKNIHNAEPAMGYYVDGVSFSKSYMFDFPLFDVERVEILKGPQGTLYGRNSMAGVINVITSEPDNISKGKVSLGIGEYNLLKLEGNIQTPLVHDKLFLSAAGLGKKQDGYMENTIDAAGDEGRHTEGGAGRIKLKYLPSDNLDITLSIDAQNWDEGAFPLRLTPRNPMVVKGMYKADRKYHYSHDFEGSSETDFRGSSLSVHYEFPTAVLTSITGYRDYQVDEAVDSDFSWLDMGRLFYTQKDKDFTQEFRLASSETDNVFQWLAGFYFFGNDSENKTTVCYRPLMAGKPGNPFGMDTGRRLDISDGANNGAAVFGQGTYSVNDAFDLTLGLRYEYEDAEMKWVQRNFADSGSTNTLAYPSGSDDFPSLLPRASLAWHLGDDHMVYATFAGGHRSGGFNKLSPDYNKSYDEEMSWLYEVGSKLVFSEQKLIVNMAVFYMDIQDEQVVQFDPALNSPYIVNAGESHRLGVEAEIRFRPLTGLDINAGFTLLEAEYDRYSDPVRGIDYAGNQIFNVPEVSGNIGIQYRCPLYRQWNFLGRIDVTGVGSRYLDDANTVEEKAYALVNGKLGIEREQLDVYLWVDNLLDQEYVIFENTRKGIAEDGPPVTAGVTVSYRF